MNIKIKYLTALVVLIVAVIIAALGIGFSANAQSDQEDHLVIGLEPIEEGALESESTLLGRFDTFEEAEAFLNDEQGSMPDQRIGHCVIHLEPIRAEETVSVSTLIGCYDTFQEAVSVATEGRVRLDDTTTPDQLTDEILNGGVGIEAILSSVVIGQSWDRPFFDPAWGSVTWTAPNRCDQGYEFGIASISHYGWGDKISSSRGYSGCDQFIHYENVNYGGTNIYCNQANACETMGYISDKTSSLWWKD